MLDELGAGHTAERVRGCPRARSAVLPDRWTAALLLAALAAPSLAHGSSVAAGAAHSAVVRTTDGTLWAWGSNGNGRLGDNTTTQRSTPVQVGTSGNWLTSVTMVAAGAAHTLALKTNGTVVAWGSNADGQVGDNTTTSQRLTPVAVVGITGTVVGIAAGDYHSLAWTSDGKLYTWGRNSNGQLGLGDTTLRRQATLVTVDGNPSLVITHAAAGSAHTLVVTSDSAAWAFGLNGSGRLGDGTTTQRTTAVHVRDAGGSAITGVSKVAAGGSHSLAIKTDASGLAWGLNNRGQLGDGSTTNRSNPVAVASLSSLISISAGASHSLAIESDGTVYAWGDNSYGQLGDGGVTTDSALPALVVEIEDAVTAVAASNHSLAVTSTGVVWVWGLNSNSQLGDGTTESRFSPVAISAAGFDWKVATPTFSVASGTYTTTKSVSISCATPGSPTIRYTLDGSDPTGSSALYTSAVSITVSTTLKARAFLSGKPDSNVGTAIYELKVVAPTVTPGTATYSTPQAPTMSTTTSGATIRYTTDGSEPTGASTAYPPAPNVASTLTLKAKAFLAGWTPSDTVTKTYTMKVGAPTLNPAGGSYTSAQSVTVSTVTPSATLRYTTTGVDPVATDPVVVSGGTVLVDHTMTLKVKGWRSSWTASDVTVGSYFLNLGTVATPTFTPPAGSYTSSQTVSISSATPGAVIRYTLDGSNPNVQSPIFAGGFVLSGTTTVKAVALHPDMSPSAVATAVYTINLGAVEPPALNVASGAYTTARTVTVSCTTSGATIHYTTNGVDPTQTDATITSGGTLSVDRSMIVKAKGFHATLPASATVRRDYIITGALAAGGNHSLALKADGTVWSFGLNQNGQLGDTTTTQRSSPVQVNGLTGVVAIAAGEKHSLALMADGSLKSWGLNTSGQLGDGSTTQRTSPVSVTGLSGMTIVAIAAGESHSLALKSDGTLLAWGSNALGQLGIGPTPTESSSPVTVTGLTGVVAIAAGANHSLVLKSDGSLKSFGHNWNGQLGDGTNTNRNTPAAVSGPAGIAFLAAGGNSSFALKTNGLTPGTLWAFGFNQYGQLGDATNESRNKPLSGASDIVSLGIGERHTLAITLDGVPWTWGDGASGQLGNGLTLPRAVPTRLYFTPELLTMDGGTAHSLALGAEGKVYSFGVHANGQLGLGTPLSGKTTPVEIPSFLLATNSWLVEDSDEDELSNVAEYRIGTDPLNPDSNGNGLSDGLEFQINKRPFDPDTDGDGLTNAKELQLGTDPDRADTDGDGVVDGMDAFPLDSTQWQAVPNPSDTTAPTITLQEPTNAVLLP